MLSIEPPDTHYLSAALGWVELGNPAEARAELERVSSAVQAHPDYLEVKLLLHASEKNWPASLETALALIEKDPSRSFAWLQRAYALRRVEGGGLQAAWDALLPAAAQFPKESIIPYNLACYACQLGQLEEARKRLQQALKIGNKQRMKTMALSDADLQPLWLEIKEW